MKKTLAIESLVIDKRYQSRVGKLDKDHVADLVSAYAGPDGDSIDAPRVFEVTGKGYILTRGFHRVEALSQSGRKRIECEVKGGTIADALTDAAASNIGHGLKRTNADKRRSVEMILEAHPDWSDRQVAESAGVTHPFVSEMRQVVTVTTSNSKTTEETQKRTGRDGKQHPASRNGKPQPKNDVSPGTKPEETNGKPNPVKVGEPCPHEDGTPDMPGVYRPLFMRNENGHEVALDLHKNPIPDKIGDVFADTTLRELLADAIEASEKFDAMHKAVLKMKRSPKWVFVDGVKIEEWATKIRDLVVTYTDHLREAVPTLGCPACGAAPTGCKVCRTTGYISRGIYDTHPEYQKKKRA